MLPNRHHFDDELGELRVRLLEMGTTTEELVRDAIIALTTQDMPLASTIIPRDDVVDRMDVEIEAMCLRLMARQQPLAADLRLIGASLKVITDIERIGDHAVDISRIAQRMEREMVYKPLVDVPRLGEMARAMLHDSLEAFIHRDLSMVEKVLKDDDAVDALYARMRRELQEIMQRDTDSVMQASYLLFVAHYIERMCDHCCNIVERVSFMETGRLKGRATAVSLDKPATAENRPANVPLHAEAA
jgi:phosphate transport system protein